MPEVPASLPADTKPVSLANHSTAARTALLVNYKKLGAPKRTIGRVRTLRTFDAFHNRSFRFLWPANFFSYISRWMQMTLLIWYVLDLTGSAFQVALVGFFGMAPMLLLGMVGGALADRFDRRRLLLGVQMSSLVGAGITTALLLSGLLEVWHAYLLISISGVGWALDSPSRRSILLNLVGRAAVTNAVALDSMAMHSSRMAGPVLAGLLISLVDVPRGYVVILVFYVLSLSLMWLVKLAPEQPGSGQPRGAPAQSMLRNLAEGLKYVRGHRTIVATILVTIIMNLFVFSYMQMVPVIAVDVLRVGPGLVGLLMGVDGFGSLMGSVLIASSGNMRHHGRVYLFGSTIAIVALLLFSLSRSYALSFGILLVLGLGGAGFGTMQSLIVMLVCREEMRGRALGVVSLAIGTGPLGLLMTGAVADWLTPSTAIGLNAVAGLVLMALVVVFMPSLRRETLQADQSQEPPQPAEPTLRPARG